MKSSSPPRKPGQPSPQGGDDRSEVVIFRRFRRTRDGQWLDAHSYGLKAWPIRIKPDKRAN